MQNISQWQANHTAIPAKKPNTLAVKRLSLFDKRMQIRSKAKASSENYESDLLFVVI